MSIYRLISLLAGVACCISSLRAQEQHPASCRTPEVMQEFYTLHPEEATKEMTARQSSIRELKSRPTTITSEPDTYHIAVVFHVYGTTFNSGVAYYPSSYMSDNKLARIVYNGAYLHTNTDPEFASVLTHEFGHFFNLIHTFERGCTHPNDEVEDTPPCTSAQGCHPSESANLPQNCYGDLINAENYMDYNSGCYKMFTRGQIKRVDTALYFPSRITLWQDSTLASTGLSRPTSIAGSDDRIGNEFKIYPNPVASHITIRRNSPTPYDIQVFNTLGQAIHRSRDNRSTTHIHMEDVPPGLYYIHISDDSGSTVQKITRL